MKKLFLLLIVCLAVATVSLRPSLASLKARRARAHTTSLQSLGSDMLVRPDSEDSPEYQEYLRQLLSLQANRAKSGHSAPSSGSSDAYIAKLNRLKVEKLALERAGVRDVELDTSYKPEDFEAAKFEAMEPQVASAVLTGDAAVARPAGPKSTNKERPLTDEEMEHQRLADERVQAALAAEAALPPEERAAREAKRLKEEERRSQRPELKLDPEANSVIENILGRSKGGDKADKVLQPPVEAFEPRPASEVATPSPPSPVRAAGSAGSVIPKHSSPSRLTPAEPVAMPTAVGGASEASPMPAVSAVGAGRALGAEEMEVAARALQSAVKHRGGGPFGPGRLEGADGQELVQHLRAALDMLSKDTAQAGHSPAVSAPLAAAPPAVEGEAPNSRLALEPEEDFVPPNPEEVFGADGVPKTADEAKAALKALKPKTSSMVEEIKAMNDAAENGRIKLPAIKKKAPPPVTGPPQPVGAAPVPPAPSAPPAAAPPPPPPPPPPAAPPARMAQAPAAVIPEVQTAAPAGEPEQVPLGLGINQYLADPSSLSKQELTSMRDTLIQMMATMSADIAQRPDDAPVPPAAAGMPVTVQQSVATSGVTLEATKRIAGLTGGGTAGGDADLDKEVKLALSLLLKHRGGPGFGHGRLEGEQLALLEHKLRNVASRLQEESNNQ